MKKYKFYILFLLFLIGATSFGQRCASTVQNHDERLKNDRKYAEFYRAYRQKIKQIISLRNPNCAGGPVIIPVAVHFDNGVVPAAQEACAVTLVQDQIQNLIDEFNGADPQNVAYGPLQNCFPGNPAIGNACLDFCLATQNHPQGYGLVDGEPAVTFGKVDFNNINPGSTAVPIDPNWAGYLNIFVGNLSGGLLGESAGIPGNFSGEGVVIDACTFGSGDVDCPGMNSSASCGGIYNEGNTLTHEVGHYLGLFHIWGDNSTCNGVQDQIADTPDMDSNYGGYTSCNDLTCADLPSSCGSKDMYMNYMSYAGDACMYMFTSDQADVTNATAIAAGFSTATPSQCAAPVQPVVAFTWSPDPADLCPNAADIQFSDQSTGPATSWAWTFAGAGVNPTTSSEKNPLVSVTSSGILTATLTVSNAIGSSGPLTHSIPVTILNASDAQCQVCDYTLQMHDSFGDGWNGATVKVMLDGVLAQTITLTNGFDGSQVFQVTSGQNIELVFTSGAYDYEITFELVDPCTNVIYAQTATPAAGTLYTGVVDCNCSFPTCNDGLQNGNETGVDCGGPDCPPCPVCNMTLYDSGGPSGTYSNNEDTLYTLCPDMSGQKIMISFVSFDVENQATCNYDKLSIYNGLDTTVAPLGSYCGTTLPPDFTSTSPDGCLSIHFTSDYSIVQNGWEISVSCMGGGLCNTVNNTLDSGAGSLRDAIQCSAPGDTIIFDNAIIGDTIFLTTGALTIDKNLIFLNSGQLPVFVQAGSVEAIVVNSGANVLIKNMAILGAMTGNTPAITNDGIMSLDQCQILSSNGGGAIKNNNTLIFKGVGTVK